MFLRDETFLCCRYRKKKLKFYKNKTIHRGFNDRLYNKLTKDEELIKHEIKINRVFDELQKNKVSFKRFLNTY